MFVPPSPEWGLCVMVWYVQSVPGTPLCGHVPGLYQLLLSHSVGDEIVCALSSTVLKVKFKPISHEEELTVPGSS